MVKKNDIQIHQQEKYKLQNYVIDNVTKVRKVI